MNASGNWAVVSLLATLADGVAFGQTVGERIPCHRVSGEPKLIVEDSTGGAVAYVAQRYVFDDGYIKLSDMGREGCGRLSSRAAEAVAEHLQRESFRSGWAGWKRKREVRDWLPFVVLKWGNQSRRGEKEDLSGEIRVLITLIDRGFGEVFVGREYRPVLRSED